MHPAASSGVAVCICTFRRPGPLRELLGRMAKVAADASELAEVAVVIIDDDPEGSAEPVAAAFESSFDTLVYRGVAAQNISIARNHAIDVGSELAGWLALIDDDCMPDEDWLRQLLVVRDAHGADCVSGCCVDVAPAGGPAWLSEEPFLAGFAEGTDGEELDIGALKNTLISAAFLEEHHIRFDPTLGRIGGEDVLFFHACHAAGMEHRYAAHAIVRELVPVERATLRYQWGRNFWYGNTASVTCIATGRYSRGRMLAAGLKTVAQGAAGPLVRAGRRRPLQLRYAVAQLLQGVGRVLGSLGVRVRHR